MGTLGPALFALQQQMQPQQQQPQASPVQPGTSDDPLTNAMVGSMQAGQQQFGQDVQRRAQLAQQLQQLQGQQAQLQPPKTGYEPHFQPMNSVGHVLGDIGKGALLGLSATGPGRAVSQAIYGPGERRYSTQAGSLANQIAEIQKQMGSESEAMGAAAGMASKPMNAAARVQVAQMNNKTRQLHDAAWQKLQQSKQQLDRDVAAGKITQAQAHDKIEQQINAAHDQTLRDITNSTVDERDRATQIQAAEGEWKVNRENMLGGYLGSQLGIMPNAPSQSPNAPPGPKAAGSKVNAKPKARSGPPAGATHIGTGKDGQDHYIDAQGKDLGLVNAARR